MKRTDKLRNFLHIWDIFGDLRRRHRVLIGIYYVFTHRPTQGCFEINDFIYWRPSDIKRSETKSDKLKKGGIYTVHDYILHLFLHFELVRKSVPCNNFYKLWHILFMLYKLTRKSYYIKSEIHDFFDFYIENIKIYRLP